jgi:hypothetical protein
MTNVFCKVKPRVYGSTDLSERYDLEIVSFYGEANHEGDVFRNVGSYWSYRV